MPSIKSLFGDSEPQIHTQTDAANHFFNGLLAVQGSLIATQ